MAFWFLPELLIPILVVLLVVLSLHIKSTRSKNSLPPPQNWPIAGILPSLVVNLHRLHDYIAAVLPSTGNSFMAPIASTTRFFVTCDPANVQHVFTSNHANYPKGEEFAQIFDVTSGSLFTADGESSRRLRARYQSVLSSPRLLASMANCCHDKVEKGLLPFMARMARTGAPLDINDVVSRLVFDLYATTVLGVDPCRLSLLDMPPMQVADAMDTVMEVGFVRHIVPLFCWKLMRCLMVGPERRLAAAQGVLRRFTLEMVERRRKTVCSIGRLEENEEEQQARVTSSSVVDILSNYVNDPEYYENDDHLLQATLITYMIAGRDTIGTTLPWVFYNLAKNPHVVLGIRNKLAPIASTRKAAAPFDAGAMMVFEPEELKPLVYLQASLLESMRLYPPIPIEREIMVSSDVMPSGHEVRAGDIVIISLYSMGRMEDLWGPDCQEYNPERWLSKDGGKLRHVPSHKFLAFNSGPRMCLGKDIAISQMKTIVAAVLWNFDVVGVLLDGQQAVEPKLSCLLQMKNGLKLKVQKREM
ncbi:hypothetical protein BRADI_3g19260v3 [Brachypodium distachyon]|uniref:Cytochrome P450 n=2 Tax=Brachypodium distachyon TaxID=15368 RepID=A0A0Q3JBX6_BRADI|nr:hypothetical protein BRADI_3g19260v3 [Brachypodium distachyon]